MLFGDATGRPVKIKRHSVTTLVGASFFTLHPGIENLGATGCPVVSRKHEDRIVLDSKFFDQFASLANVVVDVGNHAEEGSDFVRLSCIHVGVFFRAMQRAMRCIG